MSFILALDQGTTSSRAILFDHGGRIVKVAQKEFRQIYPKAGWVEHDPQEIWESQRGVAGEAVKAAGISAKDIAAIGITNQRETTVLWDRKTGQPIYNAIVWQDRRTSEFCDQLKAQKNEPPSAKEKIALDLLRDDPRARVAFIDKIAAPVLNKMFECSIIP